MAKAQRKAMRPTWEGHLRLSLVTCPVALYTATERTADVHFNLINPKTNNRIRMQTVDAGTGRAVERADLVKGFQISKNKYVLLEKDELDAVKLASTRASLCQARLCRGGCICSSKSRSPSPGRRDRRAGR